MNDLEMKLACLLAAYEMDEPHVNMPDLIVGEEKDQHYADVTPEKITEWLAMEHHGDCIKLPAPCIRCFAECIKHKAQWIARRLGSQADIGACRT